MPETSLLVEVLGGVTTVRFRDNSILDALAIQRVGRELGDIIETQPTRKVLIDFRDVRFLSSEALRMVLGRRSRADRAGASVALCSIWAELLKIFKLTNLDQLFSIHENAEAARAALG
ncbi:MAG: STAS domain-containing protein [Planctomycetes bacterium]|nr:STAS domain-containing protein [Planctomycetota bacterium]